MVVLYDFLSKIFHCYRWNFIADRKITLKKNKNFHDSMKFLFGISQYFGLCPLSGASSTSHKDMYFSWFTFRTISTIFVSLAALGNGIWCVYFLMDNEESVEVSELNVLFFYVRGALTYLAFLALARNWPQLMKDFEFVETFSLDYPPPSKFLNTKLKIFTFIIFFCAGVEHFSVQIMNFIISSRCEKNIWDAFHRFFVYFTYRHVFSYISFNIFLAIFLQLLNFSMTFGWTFLDVFIIHASRNFAEKLIQLKNQIVLTIGEKIDQPHTWNSLRVNYTHILNLFEAFNNRLNNIILLSFATNIYFLLTQLFDWMRINGSETTLHHIYHAFSISLLVSRTSFVCFYGASIKEESLNIEKVLVTIPSTLYNNEINRFITEVNVSPMILTGNKYFHVTRDLILKIAGSIVTYELVMIQFSSGLSKPIYNPQC